MGTAVAFLGKGALTQLTVTSIGIPIAGTMPTSMMSIDSESASAIYPQPTSCHGS
jgi:hypothetical protein